MDLMAWRLRDVPGPRSCQLPMPHPRLRERGQVERSGRGFRCDPFAYRLTPAGVAAAQEQRAREAAATATSAGPSGSVAAGSSGAAAAAAGPGRVGASA